MQRLCFAVSILVAINVSSLAAAQQQAAEHQPYLLTIEALIDHVGEGRIDEAIEILSTESSKGVPESYREELKRTLATVYGRGGKYDGHEVVAIKPISSRLHRVYAVAYHQRQPLIYTFTMYLFDGEWKLNHVHWNDDLSKLADVVDTIQR